MQEHGAEPGCRVRPILQELGCANSSEPQERVRLNRTKIVMCATTLWSRDLGTLILYPYRKFKGSSSSKLNSELPPLGMVNTPKGI